MDPDDLLDALRGLDDDLSDLHGRLRALLHQVEEDRGDVETRELRREYRDSVL